MTWIKGHRDSETTTTSKWADLIFFFLRLFSLKGSVKLMEPNFLILLERPAKSLSYLLKVRRVNKQQSQERTLWPQLLLLCYVLLLPVLYTFFLRSSPNSRLVPKILPIAVCWSCPARHLTHAHIHWNHPSKQFPDLNIQPHPSSWDADPHLPPIAEQPFWVIQLALRPYAANGAHHLPSSPFLLASPLVLWILPGNWPQTLGLLSTLFLSWSSHPRKQSAVESVTFLTFAPLFCSYHFFRLSVFLTWFITH